MRDSPSARKGAIAATLAVSVAVWLAVDLLSPPIPGMASLLARLVYALHWACVAVLFGLAGAVEAVAHERLQTDAFDPFAGHETRRLQVNLRYLQNTLEQTVLFVPGLLALAADCRDGRAMRAVVATAIVWTLSRFAFWIGYHRSPGARVGGIAGMGQSLLVLLYVCARFGDELAGPAGAIVPVALFAALEVVLVRATRPA